MKAKINAQILGGNLGDGWTDNNQAAEALAEYTKKIWEQDFLNFLASSSVYLGDADLDIDIDIDVEWDTSGCSRDVEVYVTEPAVDDAYFEAQQLASYLTDENEIFTRFCDSDEADGLTAE